MRRKIVLAIGALVCFAVAQDRLPITGQWTLGGPAVSGHEQLTIQRSSGSSSMSSSSPVPLAQLRGLTGTQLDSSGSVARFELVRDAGTLRFEGFLKNGGGGGTFTFAPNPDFAAAMRKLGFSTGIAGLSDEKVFAMAVHDVSTGYMKDMNALGIHPDSTDQLVTMRINGVTPEYIRKARSLVSGNLSIDQLVSLRIHGIVD
jgi:hypothetical protein